MSFDVSVITPVHNGADTIAAALRSVVAQTTPAAEVVVIDDRSTDGSADAAETMRQPLADVGTKLTIIRPDDGGNAAIARNRGIEAASGDWIAFLDADDAWLPENLENAAALLADTDDVARLGHCDVLRWGSTDLRPTVSFDLAEPTARLSPQRFVELWSKARHFPNGGVVARRDRVLDIGGFDEQQVRRHDWELFLRVIEGRSWAYDPRPNWVYTQGRPGCVSSKDAECAYFAVRGLAKNLPAYDVPAMRSVLRRKAQSCLSVTWAAGDATDRRRALEVAGPHVNAARRWFYKLGNVAPVLTKPIVRRHTSATPKAVPV